MANIRTLERQGSDILVRMDDGTRLTFYTTGSGLWMPRKGSGGGIIVPPDPGNGTFSWPFDPRPIGEGGTVTSEYGPRTGGAGTFHEGIDMAPAAGTPIPSPGAGVVYTNEFTSAYGNVITIFHGQYKGKDLWTRHAHREQLSGPGVGGAIAKGEIIGTVGETGGAFGAHDHMECHVNNPGGGIVNNLSAGADFRTAINPRQFFATDWAN